MLRMQFARALTARFNRIKAGIVKLIDTDDVLGKKVQGPYKILNQTYTYASTQVNIEDEDILDTFHSIQLTLDPSDVIKYEYEPHITVRYGLHDLPGMKDRVADMVGDHGSIRVTFGPLSVFRIEKDGEPQDVLKVEIQSADLHELNRRLGILPNTQTYDYNPHMTIAYMRGGTAQEYAGSHPDLHGVYKVFDTLKFSDVDGNKTDVSLFSQVENKWWSNKDSQQQLDAFQEWLQNTLAEHLLGTDDETVWKAYIAQGFARGAARAYDDVNKRRRALAHTDSEMVPLYEGTKRQFLRDAFRQPVAASKVKLLASRTFTDLKGVTQAMSVKMTRTLTDGLVAGLSPRQIARNLVKDVDGIGIQRARQIANTEIIRAHNEGQLLALEELGVEHVGVMVEWQTARSGVCKLCSLMAGTVLTIQEAHGMIPRHPSCRCAWIPANVGEDQKGQKRNPKDIKIAIKKSQQAGGDADQWGAGTRITKHRPEGILNTGQCCIDLRPLDNYSPGQARDWHGMWTVGGGGVHPPAAGTAGPQSTKGNDKRKEMRDQWTKAEKTEFGKLTKERNNLNKKIKDGTATDADKARHGDVMKRINELRHAGRSRTGDGRGIPPKPTPPKPQPHQIIVTHNPNSDYTHLTHTGTGDRVTIRKQSDNTYVLYHKINKTTNGLEYQGKFYHEHEAINKGRDLLEGKSKPVTTDQAHAGDAYRTAAHRRDSVETLQHIRDYHDKMKQHDAALSEIHSDMLKLSDKTTELTRAWEMKVKAMETHIDKPPKKDAPIEELNKYHEHTVKLGLESDAALGALKKHERELVNEAWSTLKQHAQNTGPTIKDPKLQDRIVGAIHPDLKNEVDKTNQRMSKFVSEDHRKQIEATYVKQIPAGDAQRAFFRGVQHGGTRPEVHLTPKNSEAVVAHEFGHSVDEQSHVYALTNGFLYSRIGVEEPVHMGSGYRESEVGVADKFFGTGDRYAGKIYTAKSTEILSMGWEELMRDPVGFAKKDPEYFKLTVGILTGRLK
jgi:hypothetical protein